MRKSFDEHASCGTTSNWTPSVGTFTVATAAMKKSTCGYVLESRRFRELGQTPGRRRYRHPVVTRRAPHQAVVKNSPPC